MLLKCKTLEEFKLLDILLSEQEYKEKPNINEIIIEYNNESFHYSLKEEFNKWYIVTD